MIGSISRGIKQMFRSKLRVFLTIGGIALGVLSVIVISIIGDIGKNKINKKLNGMGMDSIVVSSARDNIKGLCEKDVERLKNVDEIKSAVPLMSIVTYSISNEDNSNTPCMLWGVDENANMLIDFSIKHGRLLNKGDINEKNNVCVIDEDMAQSIYNKSNVIGETMSVNINGNMCDYQIVGVVKNGVNILQSMLGDIIPAFIYIPYTNMQNASAQYCFDQIAVKVNNNDKDIADIVKQKIIAERDYSIDIDVGNFLSQKDTLTSIIDIISIALTVIACISLVVSGLSIMTIMLVSVNERTREIGIKKSIGASNKDIMLEFLIESAVMTLIGALIGIVLGTTIGVIGCIILGVKIYINIKMMLGVVAFSVLTGLLFGVYPAYKAATMKPIDALRKN